MALGALSCCHAASRPARNPCLEPPPESPSNSPDLKARHVSRAFVLVCTVMSPDIIIRRESPDQPDVIELLGALDAYLL